MTLRGAAPVELALHLVGRERERFGRGAVESARRRERVAQLAVDLHRQRYLVVDEQRRIERRPGGVRDHPLLAERCPASSARCGAIGRGEQDQATHRLARALPTASPSRSQWSSS